MLIRRLPSLTLCLLLTLPAFAQNSRHELIKQKERLQAERDSLALLVGDLRDSLAQTRELIQGLSTAPAEESQPARWYTEGMNEFRFGEPTEKELEHYDLNVPDSVLVQRIEAIHSAIPLTYNDDVRKWIGIFLRKKSFPRMLGLSRYYFPILEEALLSRGLPEELKYMAVIESEFMPTAKSRSGALGLMQFMPKTAIGFGLTWDSFRDDRLDPYKSAESAARMLESYYNRYHDWPMTITAYNYGPGNVDKAIERSVKAGNDPLDYHAARDYFVGRRGVSQEAQEYMGRFVAAVYVFHYYKEHGIQEDPASVPEPLVEFEVRDLLHFQQVCDLVGVPLEVLEQYNPQYYRDIIRGTDDDILRIPESYLHDFVQAEDSVYLHRKDELLGPRVITRTSDGRIIPAETEYKVAKGDNLGKIARQFGVSVSDLKSWNKLKSDNLRIGQVLIVSGYAAGASKGASSAPAKASEKKESKTETKAETKAESKPAEKQPEFTTYKVKKGDTLFKIAQEHGCSVDDLKSWNKLSSNAISIGQKLKIRK